MQRLVLLTVVLLATASGCVAPKQPPPRLITHELSASDMDFALALARYSAGIAEEISRGPANAQSVDFFFEASQRDPSNYALARKAAIGLLYRRRAGEAGELLETTARLNPTNYPILLDLATVYDIGDQPEKRADTYERAITLSPTNSDAYTAATRSYLKDGHLAKALKMLERGARHSDSKLMSDVALINAAALLKGGFPAKSIDWFEFIASISETDRSRIHLIIADIYETRNDPGKAIEHCEKAVKAKNARPDAYAKLALAVSETNFESSMKILDAAEARFPMNNLILTAIVYLAIHEKEFPAAIELLSAIEERTTETPSKDFFMHLGSIYEQAGNIERAAHAFQKGLQIDPDAHEMLNYLAYMWAEKGIHLGKAEKLSKRSLQAVPDSGAYLDTLGWIFFMQGKNKSAKEYIEKAIQAIPDDPTILDHLGDILAKDGEIKEAILNWQKSYRIEPSNDALKEKLRKHNALKSKTDGK